MDPVSMDEDDDILLRRVVTLGGPAPAQPASLVDQLHRQVEELMRAHVDLTVSPWELGYLLGGEMTAAALRDAFDTLVREQRIRVIGTGGVVSRAPIFATCFHCGEWMESVHMRDLERLYERHLGDVHGDHTTVDFTGSGRRTH